MKANILIAMIGFPLISVMSACSSQEFDSRREEVIAIRTEQPVKIDGKLDEPAWSQAPAYILLHYQNQFKNETPDVQEFFSNGVVEPGQVKLLWDEKYLYVGFDLTDQDIVAEGNVDQLRHYQKGDTAEVFLKPLNKSWYWELYVTPHGRKTAYFFPGRGLLELPSTVSNKISLQNFKVAAWHEGSLNNSWDRDQKWSAEVAIPRNEISAVDEKLDPDVPWLIFFGRYNYGRYLVIRENTAFPLLKKGGFHSHSNYGKLKMRNKPDKIDSK